VAQRLGRRHVLRPARRISTAGEAIDADAGASGSFDGSETGGSDLLLDLPLDSSRRGTSRSQYRGTGGGRGRARGDTGKVEGLGASVGITSMDEGPVDSGFSGGNANELDSRRAVGASESRVQRAHSYAASLDALYEEEESMGQGKHRHARGLPGPGLPMVQS